MIAAGFVVVQEDEPRRGKRRLATTPPPREVTRSSRFDAFWSAYPKKVGKRAARKALVAAEKRGMPPLGQVADKIAALAASPQWQRDGGAYIPHPATWLNRDGWEDEVEQGAEESEDGWQITRHRV